MNIEARPNQGNLDSCLGMLRVNRSPALAKKCPNYAYGKILSKKLLITIQSTKSTLTHCRISKKVTWLTKNVKVWTKLMVRTSQLWPIYFFEN